MLTPTLRGGLLVALAGLTLACADSISPALGGMQLGVHSGPLHMPVLLNTRLPFEYPPAAWNAGIGGTAILRLHISETGAVDSAYVDVSSGHAGLDSAALAGARELRFRAARQGEDPVDVWVRQPVIYPTPETIRALPEAAGVFDRDTLDGDMRDGDTPRW